ncbi:bifunctional folylpolyglutamate synthase/dihydrofolate synthase [Desulfofustis limnaeus]|jgi:dihydrofolate synthase/folylpolyglutamate synthase|uniref:Dihydrofolate synthase/folylpolyglutamate synthase n=1 Tax=Desulfofustis limnaeus TaxID=2740163 RepID=A0ABN6M9I4_9BACT|nr:folylpolyglutamate synthase/dihydrofolate synthase family protein [Desulfofustis limnaeus]MDX9896487.1 folylpolyglutamate synthase/dihydrofolate synthase family protein [Desulfofustis sp.]BDD87989.1 bifunctional folylpolyglutamate synthase/dihydrofolate synthase [Desulfofustis limnaeus]
MSNSDITTFEQACRYLDDLQMHKIKLGLEAMQGILARLGSPEQRCPAVHVAGTNGKGSVCTMLRTMLSGAGYRTGLFTSPHLSSVRERFRIDERFIGEDEFTRLMERVRRALGPERITYFECTTALAFCWFAEQECDLVILETGMGGRLDATNVVAPLVSVITTVSFDHQQYLGDTLEKIAYEKAGIIKDGRPVISGVTADPARTVIERTCAERSAPLQLLGRDFRVVSGENGRWAWQSSDGKTVIDNLPATRNGVWQLDNSALAVAAAVLLRRTDYVVADEVMRAGIGRAFWPGRMELIELPVAALPAAAANRTQTESVRFLLDGAHNPAGIDCLVDAIEKQFSYDQLIVVWASMSDKDYRPMLADIAAIADYLLLTKPQSERAASPEELARAAGSTGKAQLSTHQSVADALHHAIGLARQNDLIVAAGSLYLIGEFRRLLVGEVVSVD